MSSHFRGRKLRLREAKEHSKVTQLRMAEWAAEPRSIF
jgi:hypothetical protein